MTVGFGKQRTRGGPPEVGHPRPGAMKVVARYFPVSAAKSAVVATLTTATCVSWTASAPAQVAAPAERPARPPALATPAVTPPSPEAARPTPPRPLSPAPRASSPAEADYRRHADNIVKPILAHPVSDDDLARVKASFAAIEKNDAAGAVATASTITDPAARKLVDWYLLTRGLGTAPAIRKFLDANPHWPQRKHLVQKLEETLFANGGAAADIRAHFAKSAPETAIGEAALASALLATGDKQEARKLAARAWRDGDIPAAFETGFLDRFKSLLTEADHRWRLDRLLMGDRRWTASRNTQAALIRRVVPLLSPAEKKKAEARLAVYMRSSAAPNLMAALPGEDKKDWGLEFQRAQLLRRQNKSSEAVRIILSAPRDPASIVSPDDWWDERRANAFEALEKNNPKLAYELVKDAGPLTVNPLKEQRFMAGWIAMRQLDDPKTGLRHFKAMRDAADGPLSRAKADYWIARALDATGASDEARGYYDRATRERDTFHGLLAHQKLRPGRQSLDITPPARPSADEIAALQHLDALRAAVVAKKAGLGGNITRPFLANARTVSASESWSGLVAHFADAFGDTQMSLRIAKSAASDGHNLLIYSYPTTAFPAYTPLRDPPEAAFLLGIARQETEFNTQIVSGAGARGLLQVMPVTARHVCRDHKVKCDIPRLLSDKVYNTMIGSAYIADRMDEFAGNYVLTLAGYNAGPGRARQWMREFGDPRSAKVDAIDWIERIPFEETREYVGKVLSNIQIYRARLGEQPALRLDDDLGRRAK